MCNHAVYWDINMKKSPRKAAPSKAAESSATTSKTARSKTVKSKTAQAPSISVWEDDRVPAVLVSRPVPDLGKKPLAFTFPKPAPKPGTFQPGTPQFRYWTAAEALRRGADFWAPLVPLAKWQVGASLKILLDEGSDFNAYYDRNALNFFHGSTPTGVMYSGESPDVVCHEMGHAILDSFKPALWGAASHEAAAFHESFADISAILSALQLPSLCADILAATGGKLYKSSRLSRLAEQLGAGIRQQYPDAVDPDCLRNAVNSFTYSDPTLLPSQGPAAQLSSEPHSFSRVFTAAFFESLGRILSAKAANPAMPKVAELQAVARNLAKILILGVKSAPVVPNWFAQVAASMVIAAGPVDVSYGPILKAIFVRRSILSLQSASTMHLFPQARAIVAPMVAEASSLPTIALPARQYGIDGFLLVEAATQARPFAAFASAADASSISPASGLSGAQTFVDDLFRRGRVDYANAVPHVAQLDHGNRIRSHRLVKTDGGARLERVLFDCGFCCGG